MTVVPPPASLDFKIQLIEFVLVFVFRFHIPFCHDILQCIWCTISINCFVRTVRLSGQKRRQWRLIWYWDGRDSFLDKRYQRWQFGDQGGRDNCGDWYWDRRESSLDERRIVRCISDDSLGISAAETTLAIDIEIGETTPWMNDESYGAWAMTVWWSGRQRRLWRLIFRSARWHLEWTMNRTVHQRWQFGDQCGRDDWEATIGVVFFDASLSWKLMWGGRVHLLLYSFILLYNMIMSYEKGRHLMQRLLICATVTFRAIKFLHPVCLNTSWVPVRMIIQFPANCWNPHVPI